MTYAAPELLIKTDRFEGPLELLLELVEKRKLLINDISLAKVTDEYMQVVSTMQERSLPHTAHFVALAATLLLIKSKSLLPVLELTDDEEDRISNLEDSLKQYQLYRDAGVILQKQFGTTLLYERGYIATQPVFAPDQNCNLSTLHQALWETLQELPLEEKKPKVQVKPTVTLEEMIDRLAKRVAKDFKLSFSSFHGRDKEKRFVAVSFLAVLELCKQGTILVRQEKHFADIEIEAEQFSTPQYY